MNEEDQVLAWTIDSPSGTRFLLSVLTIALTLDLLSIRKAGDNSPAIHAHSIRPPRPLQKASKREIVRLLSLPHSRRFPLLSHSPLLRAHSLLTPPRRDIANHQLKHQKSQHSKNSSSHSSTTSYTSSSNLPQKRR